MNNPFKEGDRVYSVEFGPGYVIGFKGGLGYPVEVRFDRGRRLSYSDTGKRLKAYDVSPTLFHANSGEVKFDTTVIPDLKVDQPIWVRNYEDRPWVTRHFARFVGRTIYCYHNGRTSHTSNTFQTQEVAKWKYFTTTDPTTED